MESDGKSKAELRMALGKWAEDNGVKVKGNWESNLALFNAELYSFYSRNTTNSYPIVNRSVRHTMI
jgi:hypothetical protein